MQKISSYKVTFYDMDGEEVEVELPEWAYQTLDEAISEYEDDCCIFD